MHILHVVGARPNFMKAAPVLRALTTLLQGFRDVLFVTTRGHELSGRTAPASQPLKETAA